MSNTELHAADINDVWVEAERVYHMLDIVVDDLFWADDSGKASKKFHMNYARYRALTEVARAGVLRICELAGEIAAQPSNEVKPNVDD